ncbi:MAG TPA: hypothetical protein VHZ07_25550 [Bryobacteraceae bacterium]|jgi:hypothetical protein|nr:hypothetical protein [Bryobacteraceae bacterium]
MPLSEQDQEFKATNETIVASLREGFGPLTTGLTWEIEPAPVYSPQMRIVEDSE